MTPKNASFPHAKNDLSRFQQTLFHSIRKNVENIMQQGDKIVRKLNHLVAETETTKLLAFTKN